MAARSLPTTSEQPDFALIYAFLGSLFDPSCGAIDHMDVLEEMKDIDRQTATLLMRNVISNLQSPEVSLGQGASCRLSYHSRGQFPGCIFWQAVLAKLSSDVIKQTSLACKATRTTLEGW